MERSNDLRGGEDTRIEVYYSEDRLMSRHVDAPAPPSRRIKELEVMVADVVVETPDASTLVFVTGNDHLESTPAPAARRTSRF